MNTIFDRSCVSAKCNRAWATDEQWLCLPFQRSIFRFRWWILREQVTSCGSVWVWEAFVCWEMGLATRQWIALATFYTSYLIFGAAVFYHIEHEQESERRASALQTRIYVNGKFVVYDRVYVCVNAPLNIDSQLIN